MRMTPQSSSGLAEWSSSLAIILLTLLSGYGDRRQWIVDAIEPPDMAIETLARGDTSDFRPDKRTLAATRGRSLDRGRRVEGRGGRQVAARRTACSPLEAARVSDWTYWVRRDQRLQRATDRLDDVRPADTLEVELRVSAGCGRVPVEIASFRGRQSSSPTNLHDRDAASVGAGIHILAVEIPAEHFTVELSVRPYGRLVLDAGGR